MTESSQPDSAAESDLHNELSKKVPLENTSNFGELMAKPWDLEISNLTLYKLQLSYHPSTSNMRKICNDLIIIPCSVTSQHSL